MEKLRIAVQAKGRLNEKSMKLLDDAGISVDVGSRKLLASAMGFPLEVLFLRDDDIPLSVQDGVADIGVVGENELYEKGAKVEVARELGFGKCRLSLAIPKNEEYSGLEWFNGKIVATSYPKILSDYFAKKGINASIHEISGSVEVAPSIGMADAIFDIVSSGSTLVKNRLKEVEVTMHSQAVLLANPNISDKKRQILDKLQFRLNAVQSAKDKKYVLLNIPSDKIEQVIEILPGMTSPTVMPLAREGWSSVHSVIDDESFWDVIDRLKEVGAEGILVSDIEKLIL
ncbi:MAG: ATP phosphoribosyltransferase [Bacteroidales bacterium]